MVGLRCATPCQSGCRVVLGDNCGSTGLEDGQAEAEELSAGTGGVGSVDTLSEDQTDGSGFPLAKR